MSINYYLKRSQESIEKEEEDMKLVSSKSNVVQAVTTLNVPSNKVILRGEIWTANFGTDNVMGSEQCGYKPVLIIQNDKGNKHSSTVIVATITSKNKNLLPTHVDIQLRMPSIILCEQLKTISKDRLVKKIGKISEEKMMEVNMSLLTSLGVS